MPVGEFLHGVFDPRPATRHFVHCGVVTANEMPLPAGNTVDPARKWCRGTLAIMFGTPMQREEGAMSLHKVRVRIADDPGALASLSHAVASLGGNILALNVLCDDPGSVVDELYVSLPSGGDCGVLAVVLEAVTGHPVQLVDADPHDLVDSPTRALRLASQALAGGDLAEACRRLVDADEVVSAEVPPQDDDDHMLVLPVPDGTQWLVAQRYWAPFTPAERTRAEALLGMCPDTAVPAQTVLLSNGTELRIEVGGSWAAPDVAALVTRCSATSRYDRFSSGLAHPHEAQLERLLGRRDGHSLLVRGPSGQVVAMANLVGDGVGGDAELAVLVEDGWQRRGLGTLLVRRLLSAAAERGHRALHALVSPDNKRMFHTLSRVEPDLRVRDADGLVRVDLSSTADVAPPRPHQPDDHRVGSTV